VRICDLIVIVETITGIAGQHGVNHAEELAAVPEGANLGLGCGNPQVIAAIKSGEVVVDLGSGAGFDCLLAARQVGPIGRVIGVDMTPAMLEKARTSAASAGTQNVEFREGFGEALPVEDSWADVVISNGVLNLMPDKDAALREMARVLKPGGRLQIGDILVQKAVPNDAKKDIALWTG